MKAIITKVLHFMLFAFVLVMFIAAYGSTRQNHSAGNSIKMQTGWTVKYNDSIFEDVDFSTLKFSVTNNGDWLVLSSTLPDKLPKHSTMCLNMVFSVTTVYIDGEKCYEYGMEEYNEKGLLGYGNTFFAIPDNCEGKPIKITMSVTENNAFSSIVAPIIYETENVYGSYYSDKIFPLVVGITLVVAGMCISIVTFCLFFKSYSMEKLFCVGVFAVCIGMWSICNYNLNYLFAASLNLKVYFEYLSLYLVLFPLLLYFREDVEERAVRWESFAYYMFLIVEIQLFVISIICQATNTIHFPSFLRWFQVYMVLVAVFVVHLITVDFVNGKSHKILTIGFAILVAIGARDIIAFNVSKYLTGSGIENEYKSYIAAGALILVVTMLVDFINEMRKRMYKTAETEFLEKIAYVDVLTDLYTRRKCEEIFELIDSRSYEYAIIQFDLNNLKSTNDDFGHEAGDELIKRFADILRKTFDSGETLGRMGGDEFVVMVTDAYNYDVDSKIKYLNELIEADNELHEDVKVSVSCGYARSKEFEEPHSHEVYMEADRRMYKEKEAYYQKRGYKRRRYDND